MNRCLWAGMMWLIALLVRRIEGSGGVPADEFRPAFFGYALIIPIQLGALGLFLSQVLSKSAAAKMTRTEWLCLSTGSTLFVTSFFSEYLAVLASLAFLMAYVSRTRSDNMEAVNWPGFSLRGIAVDLGRAWLPILIVTMSLGLGELYFFTSRFFSDGIIQDDLFVPYLLSLAGFSTLSALKVLMVLVRLTVIAIAARIVLSKLAPKSSYLFDLIMGGALVGSFLHLFWQTMRDELMSLEALYAPWGSVMANFASMVITGGLMLAPLLRKARLELQAEDRFTGIARLYGRLFIGQSTRSQWIKTSGIFLIFVGFRFVLYPQLEDYRTKLFDTFAQLAILTGGVLLVPLGRVVPRKAALLLTFLLTGFGIFSSSVHVQRGDVRLVAFEYSRFCALGASAPWARFVDSQPVVGLNSPEGIDPFPKTRETGGKVVSSDRPPIFLIIWDAARPDHLGAYGYHRETTPHLNELAADGFRFSEARSTATATTLGIRNMMTGCYSTRFMLAENHAPFFVCNLAESGYQDFFVTVTGNDYNGVSAEAFQRSWNVPPQGLNFAFRDYSNKDELKPDKPKTNDLLAYINKKVPNAPGLKGFFHYLHLTGTHSPWLADDPVKEFGKTAIDRYDAEIAKVDALLGALVALLKEKKIYHESIIIVTADHGTGLGEHGRLGGFLPYEEQLRIPLVVKTPKREVGQSSRPISNLDIAPTLLELVGGRMDSTDGASFADVLTGKPRKQSPRALVSFCAFRDGYAVYDPAARYKLHHYRANGYEALFDLHADPGETRNLLKTRPDVADELRLHLDHFLWRGRDRYGNPYHYRAWDLNDERKKR